MAELDGLDESSAPGEAASVALRRASVLTPAAALTPAALTGLDAARRGRDSTRRRLLALADAVAVALAALATAGLMPPGAAAHAWPLLVAAPPMWVVLNKLLGLYDRDANLVHKSTLDELPRTLQSALLGSGLIYLVVPPLGGIPIDRTQTISFALLLTALMPALRWGTRRLVQGRYPPERTVIVGAGRVADLVARKVRSHPEYGVDLVGCTDIVDLDRFEAVCRELRVERVVIAFSTLSDESLLEAIRVCKTLNLKITVVPRLFEVIGGSVEIDQLEGMTLLGVRGLSRTRSSLMLKRAIDIAGAALGLLLLAPLYAAIALLIKLDSRGAVLYSHMRIGRGNKPFRLHKFRTMVTGADDLKPSLVHLNEASAPMFKIRDDPRITRVGGLLRRTSLDELPQLVNVLRGEMSLVGPRPLVPDEDDRVIGWHRSRLALTPGLTGPWQVMGRTAIPFEEMVKLDYLYVADWSLWNDLKLLVRTAPVVFSGNGH
jgi:exopolysaccharide biosynthesis polyprenyl glycosylphosphotransferase